MAMPRVGLRDGWRPWPGSVVCRCCRRTRNSLSMIRSFTDRARNRVRRFVVGHLTAPRPLAVPSSKLRFHVHSAIEAMRVGGIREPWTVAWLQGLPPGTCLYDIGANIGITALLAAERADRSVRVVAIEPFPANFASLVKNIVLNGLGDEVTPLAVGIGPETGIKSYNWANAEAGGALHSFGDIVRPRTGERVEPVSRHGVLCYRLDDLVALPGLRFPTHFKIDVDGGELEVLAGAERTLADPRCQALQIEVNERGDDRRRLVCDVMARAGLSFTAEHAHGYPGIWDMQFARH